MRSDHQAGRSYGPSGHTPVMKATGKRFSANLITAISNEGFVEFVVIEGRFNANVFKQFLAQLKKYKRRKIYFVTDGNPAHKAKRLKEWLEKTRDRIEVIFLPAYSPELNPVEYVNQDLKTNIVGKKRAINKKELCENATQFMMKRKSDSEQTKKCFHHQKVKYAA